MSFRRARAIQAAACQHFGIETDELLGPDRSRTFVRARHLAMYLCRERLQLSYPEIGMVFGKDHSTVLGACQRMRSQLPGDAFLRGHLAALESLIARETA